MARRRRHPGRRTDTRARDPFDPLDGPVSATLDLHGFSADEAQDAVIAFLEASRTRNPGGLVHIITGKGRRSAGRPVLLQRIRTLLRSGRSDAVAAWGLDLDGGGYLVRLAAP